jgi:toxin ParE1/3/4
MPTLSIRPLAEADLLDIWDFIAEDSEAKADRFLDVLNQKLQAIAQMPGMGRRREELAPGLRSFPVRNYSLFYQITEDGIDVVRVIHGSRDIEALFEDDD